MTGWRRLVALLDAFVDRVDDWQQRRAWSAITVAVLVRHQRDEGGRWGALLAHFAFLSLLPFLLLVVTGLGFALEGHPAWQRQVLDTVVADLPVVGHQIRANVTSLGGSVPAVVVGTLGAWYGGTGVLRTAHSALDAIGGPDVERRLGMVRLQLRVGLVGFCALVALLVAAAAGLLIGLTATSTPARTTLATAASLLLGTAVLAAAYRWLTSVEPTWRQTLPGALVGALGWTALHGLGGVYLDRVVREATLTYGTFAVVIGLLAWLYLLARVFLLAAELNWVLAGRGWPVSLRA